MTHIGVKVPNDASGTIRKLLNLRDTVRPCIKYIVGDGLSTFLWVDNWHTLGPLYKKIEYVGYTIGRATTAKVASIIRNGVQVWPNPRCAITRQIVASTGLSLMPNPLVPNSVRWLLHKSGVYTTKSAWNALRTKFPVVPWSKCVWFPSHVPRCRWSFIKWLAILGRLPTKDRLHSWGLPVDGMCPLCQDVESSHDHLFFECSYSQMVLQMLLHKNNIQRHCFGLASELDWMYAHRYSDSCPNRVYKLSIAASIYLIWRERN